MTLEEIKSIAGTWFEWPSDDRYHVTYTSAMLFARDMYQLGQKAERDRIKQIIDEVGRQGNHDKWFDCVDAIAERIDEVKK